MELGLFSVLMRPNAPDVVRHNTLSAVQGAFHGIVKLEAISVAVFRLYACASRYILGASRRERVSILDDNRISYL